MKKQCRQLFPVYGNDWFILRAKRISCRHYEIKEFGVSAINANMAKN
jgi:hypothetical protein